MNGFYRNNLEKKFNHSIMNKFDEFIKGCKTLTIGEKSFYYYPDVEAFCLMMDLNLKGIKVSWIK